MRAIGGNGGVGGAGTARLTRRHSPSRGVLIATLCGVVDPGTKASADQQSFAHGKMPKPSAISAALSEGSCSSARNR